MFYFWHDIRGMIQECKICFHQRNNVESDICFEVEEKSGGFLQKIKQPLEILQYCFSYKSDVFQKNTFWWDQQRKSHLAMNI